MKGKLLLIGGNVDKGTIFETGEPSEMDFLNFFEQGILERILFEIKPGSEPIEIITSASVIPYEVAEGYKLAFKRLGKENVGVLNPTSKEEADHPEILNRLKKCSTVMFSGGDQCRIEKVFSGTLFLKILKERLQSEEGFLVSGTSAGAMTMGQEMIGGDSRTENVVKEGVIWGEGLGFINTIIIDTHFVKRKRFSRLIEAVATFPDLIGVGLGEDAAVLIKEGELMETIGSGLVVLMDARETTENSIGDIQPGEHICLEKIILHIIPKGRKFNLNNRHLC